eukprot:GSChrysophyteH1.ASY1.ANO1.2000.1 assembled CDS
MDTSTTKEDSLLDVSPSKTLPPRPGVSSLNTSVGASGTKPVNRRSIYDLANETISYILRYVRATDLVAVSEVDRTVFHQYFIRRAVKWQISSIYNTFLAGVNSGVGISSPYPVFLRGGMYLELLYTREVKGIIAALSAAQPIHSSGAAYWVSTNWIGNARKYIESLTLPDLPSLGDRGGIKRKTSRIRARRGSDALPPWPAINADIVCPHGNLALLKNPKAKRRLVSSGVWHFLRLFYPAGPTFKARMGVPGKSATTTDTLDSSVDVTGECIQCLEESKQTKSNFIENQKKELLRRIEEYIPASLESLAQRRSGVPTHLLRARHQQYVTNTDDVIENLGISHCNDDISPSSQHTDTAVRELSPLLPGLYNLVPRAWLKTWRTYTREPQAPAPSTDIDCSRLLCHSHGLLVIPPHVEEYLSGQRRSLLGGLGSYEGDIVEIVSAEEWEILQTQICGLTDVSVGFSLEDDGLVTWSCNTCNGTCALTILILLYTPVCYFCTLTTSVTASLSIHTRNSLRPYDI